MTWPYVNPKSLGWGLFESLTSVQMSQVNANAAAAADGSSWTDAALSNVVYPGSSQGDAGETVFWCPFYRYWYSFGSDNAVIDGTPPEPVVSGRRARNGRLWFTQTVPGNLSMFGGISRHASASNGAGTLLFGGYQKSGDASCLRRSTDGDTWTAESSSTSTNRQCSTIGWIPFLSLFIAGYANGAIETSATGATATWTNQTVPDAEGRSGIATNGSIVVVGGTSHVITSTNGTSWTQRTLAIANNFSVTYSPYWGKFYSWGSSGVQSSSDGITWSSSGLTLPTAGGANEYQALPIVQYGRLLYLMARNSTKNISMLYYSTDGAATWRIADDIANGALGTIAMSPHGQLVMVDGAAAKVHYTTFRGGV